MSDILVVNSGSSSIKFALFTHASNGSIALADLKLRYSGHFSGLGGGRCHVSLSNGEGETLVGAGLTPASNHDDALTQLCAWLAKHENEFELTGVGHRVVHGGRHFQAPIVVDAQQVQALEQLSSLAPLHQPYCLAPITQLRKQLPTIPQIACFDTAFHAQQSEVVRRYALPRELSERGLLRYGFHGLSYDYIQRVLADYLPPQAPRERVIVAHLGNGASLCGIQHSQSVASTMGFSALEGLPMGTRSGSVDPGLVLHLLDQEGMSAAEVSELLYRRSGLLGVSGISGDMQVLLASGAGEAEEAIELYCHRIAHEIGGLVADLGGVDQLVFTAGIGEHAADIRARVLKRCAWLGAELDIDANAQHGPCITMPSSRLGAWVIPTDEARMIAWHCLHVLQAGSTEPTAQE